MPGLANEQPGDRLIDCRRHNPPGSIADGRCNPKSPADNQYRPSDFGCRAARRFATTVCGSCS
jgi:hypothetical protein